MSLLINQAVIFNFSKPEDVQKWEIINDGVMGGKSAGYLSMDDQGNGVFRGMKLDIENYAGKKMNEISILAGNKKEEPFRILIDRIETI